MHCRRTSPGLSRTVSWHIVCSERRERLVLLCATCGREDTSGSPVRGEEMDTRQKLAVLSEACSDSTEFDLVFEKLLDLTRSQQRLRLARYERDLREFEERYSMDSAT